MAPIIKKPGASSTAKSGTGFGSKSSSSLGSSKSSSGGKSSSGFGSISKSNSKSSSSSGLRTASFIPAVSKSSDKRSNYHAASAKSSSAADKSPSFLSVSKNYKSPSYETDSKQGKSPTYSSSSAKNDKSSNYLSTNTKHEKSSNYDKVSSNKTPSDLSGSKSADKTSTPLLLGGTNSSVFASNPNKTYPSTSFGAPKKNSTAFGLIWIPTKRRNKKKDYVHVSHHDDRSKNKSTSPYRDLMSGDSSTHQQNKKSDEDGNLVLERPKGPIATAASGALAAVEGSQEKNLETANLEEKQEKPEFIKHDKEENNDGAGDFKDVKDDKTYIQNESVKSKSSNAKCDKEKGDLVDSVFLRSPPPHKVRSNTSNDDEDCGIKCLYYTLQCCDCVLM